MPGFSDDCLSLGHTRTSCVNHIHSRMWPITRALISRTFYTAGRASSVSFCDSRYFTSQGSNTFCVDVCHIQSLCVGMCAVVMTAQRRCVCNDPHKKNSVAYSEFKGCWMCLIYINYGVKGIVHPKNENVMFICLPQGHSRCRWLCFFSRTQRFLTRTIAVCQSYNVSQWYSRLWGKKNIHRQNLIKPCGSWRYIEVTLRHKTIGQCKRLNSIYLYFFTSWYSARSTVRSSFSQQLAHDTSSCFTADRRLISALPPPISQMDY